MRSEAGVEAGSDVPGDGAASGMGFESAMQRLEAVVDELEQGELELDDALARFEEGVRLAQRCAGALDEAERRIDVLVEEGNAIVARPFLDPDEGAAASDEQHEDEDDDDDWA